MSDNTFCLCTFLFFFFFSRPDPADVLDDDTDDVFFSPLREDFETTYDEKLQSHSQSRCGGGESDGF